MDRYAYLTILYGNILFIPLKLTILFSIDLDGRSTVADLGGGMGGMHTPHQLS